MKLLPICVNGRTDYMIDFEEENTIEDSFVITSDTDGILLSLYNYKPLHGGGGPGTARRANAITGVMLQTESGPACLSISSIEVSEENTTNENTLRIKLSSDSISNFKLADSTYSFDINTLQIYHSAQKTARSIKVIFEYESNEQSIRIYMAPKSQIRDVVLDCGSEATQMAMFNHNEPCAIDDRLEILTDILTHFGYDDNTNKYTKFVQAETKAGSTVCDASLFKSIFYAKKSFSTDEIKENKVDKVYPSEDETENDESVFRMCTTLDDLEQIRQTHIQLYNMKISSFGGIELPYIKWNKKTMSIRKTDNFFYRKYMNQFIYQTLIYFCHDSNQPDDESKCARILSLHVLVPNVYTPKRTHEFITAIQKDTQKIVEMNEEFKEKVLGVCVTAVSESDASLIGAISLTHNDFKPGTYLVMDAGKGTLDFSITKYEEKGTFKNIMKSGFVGAAAAINYGFMLDLILEFLTSNGICKNVSEDDLRQFIYENILGMTESGEKLEGGDLCHLSALIQSVDEYKIKYSTLSPYSNSHDSKPESQMNQVKLSSFVEWIKKRDTQLQLDYVDSIIDTIINYVYQKITGYANCTIDNVIFAGRGFLFSRFKEQMFNMLQKIYPQISEKTFIKEGYAQNNKNICLFITNAIGEGKYNNQLLPVPYEVDKEIVEGLLNMSYNDNSSDKSSMDKATKILDKLRKTIQSTTELSIPTNNNTPRGGINDENPFVVGYKVSTAQNISIAIGGTFYQLGVNVTEEEDARLFYNKGNIIVRNRDNQIHQLIEPTDLGTGLSFPSLFPFCRITSESEIYIPNRGSYAGREVAHTEQMPTQSYPHTTEDTEKTKSALDKLAELKNS